MAKNIKQLFQNIAQMDPPKNLYANIMMRIEISQKRGLKIRLFFLTIIAILSGVALIPGLQNTTQQFSSSGFYNYFSLLFSDTDIVLSSLNQYIYSLVESVPFWETTLLLTILFIFIVSVKKTVEIYSPKLFTYKFNSLNHKTP